MRTRVSARWWLLLCLLGRGLSASDGPSGPTAPGAATAPDDELVKLPTFSVQAERILPPPESWRYAQIEGFEILSNATDGATQRLLRDFRRFDEVLGIVWPGLRGSSPIPTALILCGRGAAFDQFRPAGEKPTGIDHAGRFLMDRETSAIVIDVAARELMVDFALRPDPGTGVALAGPSPAPEAGSAAAEDPESFGVEVSPLRELFREYVRFLLARHEPRGPAWLEAGLTELLMSVDFTRNTIVFGKAKAPPQSGGAAVDGTALGVRTDPTAGPDFNLELARRGLMPLARMFAVAPDSPAAMNPVGSLWAKQCTAFVHMCLYGRGKRYQRGFLAFADRASRGPVDEAGFRECFGKNYAAMATELRGYLEFTDQEYEQFRIKEGGLSNPPPLALREATEAEVGRIKGDALRIGGHADLARANLIVPYQRGERDPELLAALGLAELAAGESARARSFLEAAVKGKATRARAYFELARLRLAEAAAAPAGGGDRLAAAQVGRVLSPLFAGRRLVPAFPETWELIGETWMRSAVAPKRENLAVLKEGVLLFPHRAGLVLAAAELHRQHGFRAEAEACAQAGLHSSTDDATRERFRRFLAALPPVAPP